MTGVGSLSLNILAPAMPGTGRQVRHRRRQCRSSRSRSTCSAWRSRNWCSARCPTASAAGRCCWPGLGLAALASTAAIFAATIAGLIAARVVQSLGASTGQTIGRAIIRDLYDRERAASMIGLVTSVVVLMPMIAPLIGGILDTLFGWEVDLHFHRAVLASRYLLWAVLASARDAAALDRTREGNGSFSRRPRGAGSRARGSSATRCAPASARRRSSASSAARRTSWSPCWAARSAEYGLWFFLPVARLHGRQFLGRAAERCASAIDALIWWGIALTVVGCLLSIAALPRVSGLGDGDDLPSADHHRVRQRPPAADRDRRRRQHPPAGRRHRLRHDRLHPDGDRRRRGAAVAATSSAARSSALPMLLHDAVVRHRAPALRCSHLVRRLRFSEACAFGTCGGWNFGLVVALFRHSSNRGGPRPC